MIVLYSLRVNLSVAIVSMVRHPDKAAGQQQLVHSSNSSLTVEPEPELELDTPLSSTQSPRLLENPDLHLEMSSGKHTGEFDWSEKTQGLVLGAFFWGYVVLQLPGGQMADRFGGKWLLGTSILGTAILTILSPFAARWHYGAFIACRALEGFFEGCAVPTMHSMIAHWYPPSERSTAAGIIYSGMSIGTVLTMPVAALLSDSALFGGWPSVFYSMGAVGVVWFAAWAWLVSETPAEHPTISRAELLLITGSAFTQKQETKKKERVVIPWRDILTSVPVWALTITHFGQHWGFYTMLTQLPRYFKELGFDLRSNGYYSALPYLSQAITSSSVGFLCDRLLASGRFRLATLRKTFNSIAFFGTAFCLYLITLTERHRGANIALLTAALGVNGIGMAGFTVTHVDLSPRFAGTLMGMTNFVANFAGVLVPLLVSQLLSSQLQTGGGAGASVDGDTSASDLEFTTAISVDAELAAWHYVFYISALIFSFTGVVFVLFGSNSIQKWNSGSVDSGGSVDKRLPREDVEKEAAAVVAVVVDPARN